MNKCWLTLYFLMLSIIILVDGSIAGEGQDTTTAKVVLTLPQNNNDDVQTQTENVKIDDNTTAKITIKTQQIDDNSAVNKQNVSVEIKNADIKKDQEVKKESLVDTAKKIFLDNDLKEKKDTQDINIKGDYEVNKRNVITLTDGVKNININFQPTINTGCSGECTQKKNENKNAIKSVNQNKKKPNVANKKKVAKKTSDVARKEKITDNTKSVAHQEIVSVSTKHETVGASDPVDASHKSLRKFYEHSELSCVGEECKQIPLEGSYKINNNEVKQPLETRTVIIKETQPVYVINRIITVDDDLKLSDDAIRQLAESTNGKITVVDNDSEGFNTNNSRMAYNDLFKQKYDVIVANNLSYGEVAFVDDYNE